MWINNMLDPKLVVKPLVFFLPAIQDQWQVLWTSPAGCCSSCAGNFVSELSLKKKKELLLWTWVVSGLTSLCHAWGDIPIILSSIFNDLCSVTLAFIVLSLPKTISITNLTPCLHFFFKEEKTRTDGFYFLMCVWSLWRFHRCRLTDGSHLSSRISTAKTKLGWWEPWRHKTKPSQISWLT